MTVDPKAVRWGLAAGGAALAFGLWRGFRRTVERPFVYVTRVGTAGAETLHYARITGGTAKAPAAARMVKTIGTMPGEEPTGSVPETYTRLIPSPGNQRMAVLSTQQGLDFIDHNINLFALKTGAGDGVFNEHRFSGISRATFTSTLFGAFLASEAASGVPADVLAGYDWSVRLEGSPGANIPWPELVWADDDVLVAAFKFQVLVNIGIELGEEWFRFRIVPGAGTIAFTEWTAPMPPAPPAGPLSIGPNARPNPSVILYKGMPLPFNKGAMLPGGPPSAPTLKRARMVAGLVG